MKYIFSLMLLAASMMDLRAADKVPTFKVEKRGQGSPVILIPGLGSSGAVWEGTVAALEAKHECHVLTLAGFAGQPPIKGPLVETATAELAAYIKEHKLGRPAVIGHSMGGVLALHLAANHGKDVGPIIIVDSVPALGYSRPGATPEAVKAMAEGAGKQMEESSHDEFVASSTQFLGSMIAGEEGRKKAAAWMGGSDQKTVADCFRWILGTDLRPELPKIGSRALVIEAGAAPGAIPEEVFKAQYEGLKGAKLVRDPKAKHFIMFDDPEFLTAQIKSFLDK
jgi:pimeloyl-ACP methyl ester carboxylesterase